MSIPPIKNGRKNEVEKNIHSSSKVAPFSNGSSKKKRQLNCSLVFLLVFLLFYSGSKHKQWMKLWFLTCPMPDLSGRINFDPFSKTWNFFALKIPMKYSKNGQNFAMSKNALNVLIVTCWTQCKKPHLTRWSSSWYTFFLDDPLFNPFQGGGRWYLFSFKVEGDSTYFLLRWSVVLFIFY